MKKVMFLVLVLLMAVTGLYAQEAGHWTVGGRAGMLLFGFHDTVDLSGSSTSLINFNIAPYGAYTIFDNFSVQAELNFMINQGYKISGVKVTYSSLDLPVLAKYSFINEPLLIGAQAGPYLSIPYNKVKIGSSSDYDADGIAFGLTAGMYAGYPLGPGRIVGDLRFNFDLSTTSGSRGWYSFDFIKRRGIVLTFGYEYTF